MKQWLMAAVLVLISAFSITAHADQWKKLGERKVSFSQDTDTIHVSGFKGKYNKISLHFKDAPIYLNRITVFFGNGKKQNFYINKRYERGERTRGFKLLNGPRVINKVEMKYKKAASLNLRKGEVQLFGLKD